MSIQFTSNLSRVTSNLRKPEMSQLFQISCTDIFFQFGCEMTCSITDGKILGVLVRKIRVLN